MRRGAENGVNYRNHLAVNKFGDQLMGNACGNHLKSNAEDQKDDGPAGPVVGTKSYTGTWCPENRRVSVEIQSGI